MEGKILVLCDKRPTVNEYGKRIDEKGNTIEKVNGKWLDVHGKEIEVDEFEKVIDGMELLSKNITENTGSNIIYVDWETIIPSDIEPLQKMKYYAQTSQHIEPGLVSKNMKSKQSFMKKAHMDRLIYIDKNKMRPCLDYGVIAMEDFMQLFSRALELNRIVSILPTFSDKCPEEIKRARMKLLNLFRHRNEMKAKYGQENKYDILEPEICENFKDIYSRAYDEIMRMLDELDFVSQEDETGR